MIYLLLFGLDFYNNLTSLLSFLSVVITCVGILGALFYSILYSEALNRKDKEDIVYKAWAFGSYIVKRKWCILSLISVTFLLPAPKTVAIATGLYAGEQVVTYIQDSPLAKKAYQLAEKKIDELLEESQPKDKDKK